VKDKLVFSSTFAFTENTSMVSYIPKKNSCVILQSKLHNKKDVTSDIDKMPRIFLDNNKTKGGVDSVDKKITCYTCKRKTNMWPVVMFSNILDISANKIHLYYLLACFQIGTQLSFTEDDFL